jgi:predicted small lipoprotein YifL
MKFLIKTSLALIFLSLSLNACNKTVPLLNPNFEVQAKSLSDVGSAVKTSLINRQWTIVSTTASSITARYARGNASATILVSYTKSNVSIKLLSSENLLEGNDPAMGQVIHKTYAGWIKNLENDIYRELSYKI